MNSMTAAEFAANCLAVLAEIQASGEPVVVTKDGVPLAQIVPCGRRPEAGTSSFGCMKGTAEELEDILQPLPLEDWEALK